MAARIADLQWLRLVAADGQHLVVFQHAQQLHLHGQRNVRQLVEEDGAAVGQRQQPGPGLGGAGERPLDVAKQLAFHKVGVQARHVDRQERAIAVGAVAVDGAGDQLLAGAALAGDEDGGVARGHQGDALEDRLHGRALPDDLFRRAGGGAVVRGRCRLLGPALQGPGDGVERLVQVERLGQVVERAPFDRLDRRAQVAERRDDDDRCVLGQLPQLAQRGQAVHPGQANVEDDGIEVLLGGQGEGVLGGRGDGDAMAFLGQGALQRPADGFFIIDDQDVFHGTPRRGGGR